MAFLLKYSLRVAFSPSPTAWKVIRSLQSSAFTWVRVSLGLVSKTLGAVQYINTASLGRPTHQGEGGDVGHGERLLGGIADVRVHKEVQGGACAEVDLGHKFRCW